VAWSWSPLRPRLVRWQVAQHLDLAAAQRLWQRPPRRLQHLRPPAHQRRARAADLAGVGQERLRM